MRRAIRAALATLALVAAAGAGLVVPRAAPAAAAVSTASAASTATTAATVGAATSASDWDGDGRADVVGATLDGRLWLYPGDGVSGFRTRSQIGTGWDRRDQIRLVGNWDGAVGTDIIARDTATGDLWLYPSAGGGRFGTHRVIGTGWGIFSHIFSPGDWTGDGHPDLLAVRHDDRTMWLYAGDGRGSFTGWWRVGQGWGGYDGFVATGDWDGNAVVDFLVRDTASGALKLYSGNGAGGWGQSAVVGTGWRAFTGLLGPGDWSGDGNADVLARGADGRLILYRGNGRGGWITPYPTVGTGWGIIRFPGEDFAVTIAPIDAALAARMSTSWRAGCPVPLADLRYLTMTYRGFDGVDHTGEMVVAASVATDVATVFARLHEIGFPIAAMRLVDDFAGDDAASMAANNTSAFNCRAITGGTSFSEHSYGTAIDVNPVQNPYVRGAVVLPPAGAAYVNRPFTPGVIHAGDAVVQSFAAIGWSWGGAWASPIDYQHFSRSGR